MTSNLLLQTLSYFSHTRYDEPPIRLYSYPHLLASDRLLWDKFLELYPTYFDAVSYDVRVGEGYQPPGETDEAILNMAKALTQRRIDVLALKDGEIWIVEVKYNPGITLLGQLLGYRVLFLYQLPFTIPIRLFALVNKLDKDLEIVLINNEIKYCVLHDLK